MIAAEDIATKSSLKIPLTGVYTLLVAAAYYILFYTAPLIGDDAMYASIMEATTDDGGASLQGSFSAVGAGMKYDGRLSNTIACILLLLPRWLSAGVLTLALMGSAGMALKLIAPNRLTPATAVWMLLAITFFVGWYDSLFLIDLASNYLIPTVFTLIYCAIFFARGQSIALTAAGVAAGALCGVMQQISFVPLLAASLLAIRASKGGDSARRWLMTVALLGGLASLLHPHMLTRFDAPTPFSINTLLRNCASFVLLFIWGGMLLLSYLRHKPSREGLREAVASPEGFLFCTSIVIFAISLKWGTGARMALGATIFSAAGIARACPEIGSIAKRTAVTLAAILTLGHLAYADYLSISVISRFRQILTSLADSGTQQIFYHDTPSARALSLGKVIDFSELRVSNYHFWPLYSHLSPRDKEPLKVIIPSELRRIDPSALSPIEGNTGISRYGCYLLSLRQMPAGEYSISFGPFRQNCYLASSPFTTAEGEQWHLIDILMPSSLLIFYDISHIEQLQQ